MNDRAKQWDKLFMRFALDVAEMSRAERLKVGAVAVRDRRVIAIGYNGTPPGEDNCCEEFVRETTHHMSPEYDVHAVRQWREGKMWVLKTKPNVIHAEDNLIRFSEENNIDLHGCTLYITHSPCPLCGDKVINAGFKEVVYEKHYRIVTDLPELTKAGIFVRQWKS